MTYPVLPSPLDDSHDDWMHWVRQHAFSLTPDMLEALEADYAERMTRRHPDDPGSLLNLDFRNGQGRIEQMRASIDEAITWLTTRQVLFLQAVCDVQLNDEFRRLALALYGGRRAAELQFRSDQLADMVQSELAADAELQQQLFLDDRAHARHKGRAQFEHDLAMEAKQIMAEIDRDRVRLQQPVELQKTLTTLILAAWEKQERDPSFRATFASLRDLMQEASSTVWTVVSDTDPEGRPLDDEARKHAIEEAVAIVMRLVSRLVDRL